MNSNNYTSATELTEICPASWSLNELQSRAGALVREALVNYPHQVRQQHWEDMRQTAVLTFLQFADQPAAYAYGAATIALKNYTWVHIRGLNGGWKSLACIEHGYSVSNVPQEGGHDKETPETVLDDLLARTWDDVPRPVEWTVIRHLSPSKTTQEETMREVLYILAGMSGNFYPEQLYRAALIITLLAHGYVWEHVADRTELTEEQVFETYWGWRKRHLNPYLTLSALHQEVVKVRGRLRITYFEEVDSELLNTAVRKMIIFPHGIYTITYKRRSRHAGTRAGQLEASLQKGRQINGRNCVRAVHLGKLGDITKERLYQASLDIERKLATLGQVEAV